MTRILFSATTPWEIAPRGKRARKAAFAHRVRVIRRWMAMYHPLKERK